jgi:hypothetical protein
VSQEVFGIFYDLTRSHVSRKSYDPPFQLVRTHKSFSKCDSIVVVQISSHYRATNKKPLIQ